MFNLRDVYTPIDGMKFSSGQELRDAVKKLTEPHLRKLPPEVNSEDMPSLMRQNGWVKSDDSGITIEISKELEPDRKLQKQKTKKKYNRAQIDALVEAIKIAQVTLSHLIQDGDIEDHNGSLRGAENALEIINKAIEKADIRFD